MIYMLSYFNLGVFGALFGGWTHQIPRGDRTESWVFISKTANLLSQMASDMWAFHESSKLNFVIARLSLRHLAQTLKISSLT